MAIKVIDEIPKTLKASSSKELIKADIQEAIDKSISLFEFEGDYNYKYLGSYARDCAEDIKRTKIKNIQREYRTANLTDDEKNKRGFYVHFKPYWDYKRDWITISTAKGDDHRRVFCKIGDVKIFENKVLEDCKSELERARRTHKLVGDKWEWIKENK